MPEPEVGRDAHDEPFERREVPRIAEQGHASVADDPPWLYVKLPPELDFEPPKLLTPIEVWAARIGWPVMIAAGVVFGVVDGYWGALMTGRIQSLDGDQVVMLYRGRATPIPIASIQEIRQGRRRLGRW